MVDVVVYWHWQNRAVQSVLVDPLKHLSRIAFRQLDLAPREAKGASRTAARKELPQVADSSDRTEVGDTNSSHHPFRSCDVPWELIFSTMGRSKTRRAHCAMRASRRLVTCMCRSLKRT